MMLINLCLKNKLIPYFCLKYPESEESEVNLSFSKKVIEVDNLANNENDLLWKSGVSFRLSDYKEYNS